MRERPAERVMAEEGETSRLAVRRAPLGGTLGVGCGGVLGRDQKQSTPGYESGMVQRRGNHCFQSNNGCRLTLCGTNRSESDKKDYPESDLRNTTVVQVPGNLAKACNCLLAHMFARATCANRRKQTGIHHGYQFWAWVRYMKFAFTMSICLP